jgi:hypothetical protein
VGDGHSSHKEPTFAIGPHGQKVGIGIIPERRETNTPQQINRKKSRYRKEVMLVTVLFDEMCGQAIQAHQAG